MWFVLPHELSHTREERNQFPFIVEISGEKGYKESRGFSGRSGRLFKGREGARVVQWHPRYERCQQKRRQRRRHPPFPARPARPPGYLELSKGRRPCFSGGRRRRRRWPGCRREAVASRWPSVRTRGALNVSRSMPRLRCSVRRQPPSVPG